ncbi:TetR/AcrR family transcriptional regulator [Actinomadura barringtoniae]|uniref:TetR/AcrR family transcriptional regulator n=1 Tax=Actinomadura barringtoniae TaxID=1427535 RepID=A0A939PMF4_9ACTN|nr:TetR/AcrR family transcriptional regulator [Actinomadura barringtoniae]MBO2455042.1 TetR/AcrR family transcriptional regulator [Actinomadura barringtoniae]
MSDSTKDGLGTKDRLVEAARRLYAERGLDAVSLREINQAAGARNATAVQYHFAGRSGLIKEIFARHMVEIDARRHALLDACEAAEGGVRDLAGALIRPLAAQLADPGGREFLQVWAEVLNRPDPVVPETVLDDPADSLCRWRAAVEPLLEADAARLHRRFTAILYASIELARRARSGPHTDDRLFTSYLIDIVASILAAPVSGETRRLAAERDAARSHSSKTP